jgi:hypothetical protein
MFGNHGALWGNAMTWWDHDTGTVWSQPLGEAIVGPRKGARLELYPVTFTTWSAWLEAHPQTLALDAPAASTRFDLEELYLVIDLGTEAAAYPVANLQQRGVINDVVAGVEIAVVSDPTDRERWAVFSRRLDTEVVELVTQGERLLDVRTGTEWDPVRGVARNGRLAGEVLDSLPGFTSFPGDFATFWPEGRVWAP